MVQFHDPRAEPGMPVEPYARRIDLDAGPIDIALLANGFPDSESFLDHVEKVLAARIPNASFHRWNKGNASAVVSDEMTDDIVERCGAVVAAYGH